MTSNTSKPTAGPWHVFSTIVPANSPHGVEIGAGTNIYGDGPEKIVGRMFGFSDADKRVALCAPELLTVLYQYRDDLRYPPAPDSVERRLAMIEALILKAKVQQP